MQFQSVHKYLTNQTYCRYINTSMHDATFFEYFLVEITLFYLVELNLYIKKRLILKDAH